MDLNKAVHKAESGRRPSFQTTALEIGKKQPKTVPWVTLFADYTPNATKRCGEDPI